MQIEIRKGLYLQPGTFAAIVVPEKAMAAALNGTADLKRFLFLYVSGNYSRILSGLDRASKNLEVRRAFTAHQLLTILREAGHTVIFVEHDPELFDGAAAMIDPVAGALADAGREALVILYTPVPDRTFFALARRAGRFVEICTDAKPYQQYHIPRSARESGMRQAGQRTLEVV
jgi:DNA polymerase I